MLVKSPSLLSLRLICREILVGRALSGGHGAPRMRSAELGGFGAGRRGKLWSLAIQSIVYLGNYLLLHSKIYYYGR